MACISRYFLVFLFGFQSAEMKDLHIFQLSTKKKKSIKAKSQPNEQGRSMIVKKITPQLHLIKALSTWRK